MNDRTRLRVVSVIPALFCLIGFELIDASVALRSVFPPSRGIIVAAVVILTALGAVHQLWHGTRRASIILLGASAVTFGSVYAQRWLFPLVNASSEPPSFFEAYGWSLTLLVLMALSVAGIWCSERTVKGRGDH